ncbi:hypothetical protein H6P81_020716 [Aristolochia fimbriata]|uniref:Uncharacterized protein n=1 Tax=Aristolochia fimbriata TaxID=158543 RepID=A0AAV7DY66_ARIFI|nr:hypothetical protein H6P81_020716 [Aristolochia fimbriata]
MEQLGELDGMATQTQFKLKLVQENVRASLLENDSNKFSRVRIGETDSTHISGCFGLVRKSLEAATEKDFNEVENRNCPLFYLDCEKTLQWDKLLNQVNKAADLARSWRLRDGENFQKEEEEEEEEEEENVVATPPQGSGLKLR